MIKTIYCSSNTTIDPSKEEIAHATGNSNDEEDTIHFPSPQMVRDKNAQLLKVESYARFNKHNGSQTIDLLLLSLQEIEISRARIRSLSLYSPLESLLQNAIFNYIKHTRARNGTESISDSSRKVEIKQFFSEVSRQNPDHD